MDLDKKKLLDGEDMDIYSLTITVAGGGSLVLAYGIYLCIIKIKRAIESKRLDKKNVKVKISDAYMVDEDFAGFVLAKNIEQNIAHEEK